MRCPFLSKEATLCFNEAFLLFVVCSLFFCKVPRKGSTQSPRQLVCWTVCSALFKGLCLPSLFHSLFASLASGCRLSSSVSSCLWPAPWPPCLSLPPSIVPSQVGMAITTVSQPTTGSPSNGTETAMPLSSSAEQDSATFSQSQTTSRVSSQTTRAGSSARNTLPHPTSRQVFGSQTPQQNSSFNPQEAAQQVEVLSPSSCPSSLGAPIVSTDPSFASLHPNKEPPLSSSLRPDKQAPRPKKKRR